ncbi:hypothetical protein CYD30_25420 [Kosakonia cowanii]|nr:hypothetical protein CYD30_25420 [Kosakonia cowanii]
MYMAEDKGAVSKRVGRPRKFETKADKQRAYLEDVRSSKVQLRTYIEPEVRELLNIICKEKGKTQAEVIATLVRNYKLLGLD